MLRVAEIMFNNPVEIIGVGLMKIVIHLVEIVLILFFSRAFSLVSIKIFNIEPTFRSLNGLSWNAFFLIGGILIWASLAPLISLNFYASDIRRLIDRVSPISTVQLQPIDSKIIQSGSSYHLDLSKSCEGEFKNDAYTMIDLNGFEKSDPVFWLSHVYTISEDFDNDVSVEEIVVIECGYNDSWFTGHLFDNGKSYQINVGSRASGIAFKNGEIIISRPGGGPRCCPTTLESRYYHYRDGSLYEHRAREVRPWGT